MRRILQFLFPAKTIAVAGLMAGFFLPLTSGWAQSARSLRGHVPKAVGRLKPLANIAAQTNLPLAVGLPLRNKPALTNLLQDLYDPINPNFHRYLSVTEFTEQFGPTLADYQKVTDYLTSRGLRVTATHPNRMIVDVAGAAADVEKAFHVRLRIYQHPTEQRKFYAPDTDPWVPAEVPVLDVMGLDNYIVPHPLDLQRGQVGGQGGASVTNFAEQGSGPGGTYIGKDFRAAYVPNVTNTGAGQYIGLVEFGPYWPNDVPTYESYAGLSNIVISNIFLDGVTEPPASGTDAGEQALDIEMCISMAPGATVLYYGGENPDDIYSRIASDNLAKQISCSFGFGIDSTTEQLYQEFVAQGQNFFQASGDGGAEVGAIDPPACEPYITLVGGTALYTVSPGGAWQQELTWVGSGGGVSTFYAIPDYQQGIDMAPLYGSSTMRNFPDVAMMADTVIFIAANNGKGAVGGTSCSSPQYAGFYALANQQAATLGQPPLGFFNPSLYAIGQSANYTSCFHDITSGNTTNAASGPHRFFAAVGYDLCTGWGSPDGLNLINALTGIGTNNFLLYATPVALNLTVGGSDEVLVTDQPMNGFSGTVSLSVSNLPTGVTASFSAASTTTTSILTLIASSSATPGTYTVTLNGVSGSITQTVALTLTVLGETPGTSRVNLASDFNLAAIHTDGSTFSGGADGGGNGYSANLLGSALNWNGCLFNEGGANANDAVQCSGQTITLPAGKFSSLQILAAAVDGAQFSQQFIVTYSDNSTAVFTQSLSDWTDPQNFPGETVVTATAYRNTGNGTKDTVTQAVLYGYSFGLNDTKTVKSVKLPYDGNVLVFAMTLANDFTLYGLPTSIVLATGGKSVSYLISGPVNGFSGSVNLSASGLPAGVTALFNPSASTNASILTLTANATAQPAETNILLTGSLDGVTHNIDVNLSVITPIPGAAVVNLSSAFNLTGIYDDGSTFSATGGLDGAGNAYSANLFGSAPYWDGSPFSFGPAGAPDAVQCAGQTIALPAGQCTGLLLLGAALNASQPNLTFQINYTDGTSASVKQSISLWTAPQNYSGESVAFSAAYADTSGGTENTAMPVNLYGYVIALNDSKTVQSITLPSNPDVVVLAMSLANTPAAVSLASSFNRQGIFTDGTGFSGGLDGGGYAYSSKQLGASLIWDSAQFKFGAANGNNAVSCDAQTITLPTNRYTTLLMLATGVEGDQTSQAFTVNYTDGTTEAIVQSLSDWVNVTSYSNQFIAVTMPYRLSNNGSPSSATTHLFGYLFPLNNTKTVQSLKLPKNNNVEILAVSLANTPLPASLQADYNRAGIYTDGTDFIPGTEGLDNDGNALSATLLGPTESWHDVLFAYGPANETNVISGDGQTITLPQGQYSMLFMQATSVNGSQTGQIFTVNYTNGASANFSFNMSDWANPQSYGDETTVVAMGYRDSSTGSMVGPPVNVYGYTMNLNGGNVVQSLKLPNNNNVEVLAITLSNYTAALPEAPGIISQPMSLTVTNGNPVSFSVAATGSPPLHYQWQFDSTNLTDGGNISGSTTADLAFSAAGATNAGSYDVIVSNAYGSVTSSLVTLNVVFYFQSATQTSDGAVTFSWLTTPGVPYQVQFTTNLASTNWMNLGPAILASNSVTTASDNLSPDPQRFYRIIQQ